MKNKILDTFDTFERKYIKGDSIYWLIVSVVLIGAFITATDPVEANNPVYKNEICTTDKCKARVERLNSCKGNIKCAVKLTQEASYDYLHIELTNLKKKSVEGKKIVKKQQAFNLDKLAYSVAMQETKDCTLGYGKTHNNCFGIKHGNTVPCPGVPKMAMCKFKTKEESYRAFKIIWSKWYKGLPDYEKAKRWSGDDRAGIWLYNVLHFYNK